MLEVLIAVILTPIALTALILSGALIIGVVKAFKKK